MRPKEKEKESAVKGWASWRGREEREREREWGRGGTTNGTERREGGSEGRASEEASELISCRVAKRGGASREVRCARQEARGTRDEGEYEMAEEGKEGRGSGETRGY